MVSALLIHRRPRGPPSAGGGIEWIEPWPRSRGKGRGIAPRGDIAFSGPTQARTRTVCVPSPGRAITTFGAGPLLAHRLFREYTAGRWEFAGCLPGGGLTSFAGFPAVTALRD